MYLKYGGSHYVIALAFEHPSNRNPVFVVARLVKKDVNFFDLARKVIDGRFDKFRVFPHILVVTARG
jgi:hypothetical protein